MAKREGTLDALMDEVEPGEEEVAYATRLAKQIDNALDGAPNIIRLEVVSVLLSVAVLQIARQAYPRIDECNDTLDVLFGYVRSKSLRLAQTAVLGNVKPGPVGDTQH